MTLSIQAASRKDARVNTEGFQHRHFAAVAAILLQRAAHPSYADEAVKYVLDFADAFGRDNPRFDRARFLRACGVEG